MKYVIFSDSHGIVSDMESVVFREKPDKILFLGDISSDADDLRNRCLNYSICSVAGNNDFFSDLPREEIFSLGKYQVMITHGHYYGVSMGTDRLKEEALSRNIDIVMYGHTHKPEIDIEKQITVLNPGSLSYPRQWGRKPSFLIMEIDREGEAHFTVNYIEE